MGSPRKTKENPRKPGKNEGKPRKNKGKHRKTEGLNYGQLVSLGVVVVWRSLDFCYLRFGQVLGSLGAPGVHLFAPKIAPANHPEQNSGAKEWQQKDTEKEVSEGEERRGHGEESKEEEPPSLSPTNEQVHTMLCVALIEFVIDVFIDVRKIFLPGTSEPYFETE